MWLYLIYYILILHTFSFGNWSVVILVPTVGTDVEVISMSSLPFNFLRSKVFPAPIGPKHTQLGKTGGKLAIMGSCNHESKGLKRDPRLQVCWSLLLWQRPSLGSEAASPFDEILIPTGNTRSKCGRAVCSDHFQQPLELGNTCGDDWRTWKHVLPK